MVKLLGKAAENYSIGAGTSAKLFKISRLVNTRVKCQGADGSDGVKGFPSLQELALEDLLISKDGSSVQDGQLLPSITELEGRSTRSPFP
uniref:Uncharacterized protein n=1 Tax=Oryza rufipogon TaxID=4529 RepID=A0A0E0PPC5_ORYRU